MAKPYLNWYTSAMTKKSSVVEPDQEALALAAYYETLKKESVLATIRGSLEVAASQGSEDFIEYVVSNRSAQVAESLYSLVLAHVNHMHSSENVSQVSK